MARNRSFDDAEILDAAMHIFRRYGYAGVSIKQIENATGLTSGSLYNAFGNKDGLYHAALAHYVDAFVVGRLRRYDGPHATLDDLEDYFLSLLREPLNDGFGCLVTNTAIEFSASSTTIAECIRRALETMAAGIHGVLEREIGPHRAGPATNLLMMMSQGILVLIRSGQMDAASIDGAVHAHFDALRSERMGNPVTP